MNFNDRARGRWPTSQRFRYCLQYQQRHSNYSHLVAVLPLPAPRRHPGKGGCAANGFGTARSTNRDNEIIASRLPGLCNGCAAKAVGTARSTNDDNEIIASFCARPSRRCARVAPPTVLVLLATLNNRAESHLLIFLRRYCVDSQDNDSPRARSGVLGGSWSRTTHPLCFLFIN